ncbi:hypothetical protein VRK_07680 [Vibrio sp. MEBiC08052]|nr:hypothetical protein VRK_07680 [Vibrio sp. MEBiC08052]
MKYLAHHFLPSLIHAELYDKSCCYHHTFFSVPEPLCDLLI